jgi:hypothetical protein
LDRAWIVELLTSVCCVAVVQQSSYFAADGVQYCLMVESLLLFTSHKSNFINFETRSFLPAALFAASLAIKENLLPI